MSNRPIQEEQQHKRRDRRRVVSFHPKTRVLAIPTVEELSVREIQSLWPTPEESKKNQGELVACVRMARKNPRDASICTRGIEKLLDPASVARLRKCREDLIDAVLDNSHLVDELDGELVFHVELLLVDLVICVFEDGVTINLNRVDVPSIMLLL